MDTSVVISSCSLAEARHLLDHFLKASIDKVRCSVDAVSGIMVPSSVASL